MTLEGPAIWDVTETTARQCNTQTMWLHSARTTKVALLAAVALLAFSVFTGGESTPPEVTSADGFLALAGVVILVLLQFAGRGVVLALAVGLISVFRAIGDPDLSALFEGGGVGLVEATALILFVLVSLVLLLSSYGAVLLRRSGLAIAGVMPSRSRW